MSMSWKLQLLTPDRWIKWPGVWRGVLITLIVLLGWGTAGPGKKVTGDEGA